MLSAPGPPLGAQNWPTVRLILKIQTPKSSLFKTKGRGLRAANIYIFSVEKKRNPRTDGPQFWLAIRPTSILAIGGNFASGPPPAARTTSRNRPKPRGRKEVDFKRKIKKITKKKEKREKTKK